VKRARRGFTVLEVLVVAAALVPVIALCWSLVIGSVRALSGGAARSAAVHEAVIVRERHVDEGRIRSRWAPHYRPVVTPAPWM
jgi:type II secretory pathway component PulJ